MDWLSSAAMGERRTKTLLQGYSFKLSKDWLSYFAHAVTSESSSETMRMSVPNLHRHSLRRARTVIFADAHLCFADWTSIRK
jgi:hypothetical protein